MKSDTPKENDEKSKSANQRSSLYEKHNLSPNNKHHTNLSPSAPKAGSYKTSEEDEESDWGTEDSLPLEFNVSPKPENKPWSSEVEINEEEIADHSYCKEESENSEQSEWDSSDDEHMDHKHVSHIIPIFLRF